MSPFLYEEKDCGDDTFYCSSYYQYPAFLSSLSNCVFVCVGHSWSIIWSLFGFSFLGWFGLKLFDGEVLPPRLFLFLSSIVLCICYLLVFILVVFFGFPNIDYGRVIWFDTFKNCI